MPGSAERVIMVHYDGFLFARGLYRGQLTFFPLKHPLENTKKSRSALSGIGPFFKLPEKSRFFWVFLGFFGFSGKPGSATFSPPEHFFADSAESGIPVSPGPPRPQIWGPRIRVPEGPWRHQPQKLAPGSGLVREVRADLRIRWDPDRTCTNMSDHKLGDCVGM